MYDVTLAMRLMAQWPAREMRIPPGRLYLFSVTFDKARKLGKDAQRRSGEMKRSPPTSSSLKITDRSFQYASPCLWNQLPTSLRQPHFDASFSIYLTAYTTTSSSSIHRSFHFCRINVVIRQSLKRHLDHFSRFARLTRVPKTQTDRQSTLCVTSVAIDRIYAMHVMQPNNNKYPIFIEVSIIENAMSLVSQYWLHRIVSQQ